MHSSPLDELQSRSPSPRAEQGDDRDAANHSHDHGQKWLTIRRRCELCKQRKVRQSSVPQVLSLPFSFRPGYLNSLNYGVVTFDQHFPMATAILGRCG